MHKMASVVKKNPPKKQEPHCFSKMRNYSKQTQKNLWVQFGSSIFTSVYKHLSSTGFLLPKLNGSQFEWLTFS